MHIRCNKSHLLNGVTTSLKAVSSRSSLPILQSLLLNAKEGQLRCVGNDLELGIETIIEAEIMEEGAVAIDARFFSEIIRKLPDSQVTLHVDENHLTTIQCEKSEFNLAGQPATEFIQLPIVEKNQRIILNQNELKRKIQQTIFSVALENIRPTLTGELFEITNGYLNIVSIDGYRVSIQTAQVTTEHQKFRAIIPGKTLNEIQKIISNDSEDDLSLYITDKHALFEINQTMIVSRLLEGDFPKYDQIFSPDYSTKFTIERQKLLMSLERAALLARESKKNPVKLDIREKELIISATTELGNVHEELDIQREGSDLVIAFNPRYLLDVLKVLEEETISLQFTTAVNPCIIKSDDNQEYQYLILPVRTA